MAYVPNREQEDQYNQQEGIGTSVQQLSGQTSNIGGSGINTFNQPQQTQETGTGFTNINRYLEENQPQAERMTGQIVSNVEQSADTAREGIQESQNLFNQGVQSQTRQVDEDLFNQVKTDPTAITSSEDRFESFLQARDAAYTGPETFEASDYYQPAQRGVEQAQQTADKVLTDVGRKDLAADLNPDRMTTRGIGTLDNLFLSGKEPREELYNTRERFKGLDEDLQGVVDAAPDTVQAARTTNEATRQAAQAALEAGRTNFQTAVDTRLEDALARSQGIKDTIQTGIQTGADLTDDQLAAAGISREDYDTFLDKRANFYGTRDLSVASVGAAPERTWRDYTQSERDKEKASYTTAEAERIALQNMIDENIGTVGYEDFITYTDPALSINRGNVATAEDYARQQALESLMGSDIDYINNPELAGTANLDTTDVDFTNLYDTYESIRTPIQEQYDRALQASQNLYTPKIATDQGVTFRALEYDVRELADDIGQGAKDAWSDLKSLF